MFSVVVPPSVYVLVARDHRASAAPAPRVLPDEIEGDLAHPPRIAAEAVPS